MLFVLYIGYVIQTQVSTFGQLVTAHSEIKTQNRDDFVQLHSVKVFLFRVKQSVVTLMIFPDHCLRFCSNSP